MQKRNAVVIGVNHAIGGPALQGAVTDARAVEDALLGYGFRHENVTTLLDGQATRSAILSALDRLADRAPADGIAVVAIAGHTRIRGGVNQFLAADGLRVTASEFAARIRKVRSRAWISFSTCFAEGYDLPGIVGPGRIATFASSRWAPSYELGSAGSYLIIDMVREAMIHREAPLSVETAFRWAANELKRTKPMRVPLMRDGIAGDFVLGHMAGKTSSPTPAKTASARGSADHKPDRPQPDATDPAAPTNDPRSVHI